ncbi:hypothetical protein BGW80DRAFT_1256104 [Lactifluus volemus]|nr:hypothetical protein BGW80DRAFT_1256104 [Lactifluus volemus]
MPPKSLSYKQYFSASKKTASTSPSKKVLMSMNHTSLEELVAKEASASTTGNPSTLRSKKCSTPSPASSDSSDVGSPGGPDIGKQPPSLTVVVNTPRRNITRSEKVKVLDVKRNNRIIVDAIAKKYTSSITGRLLLVLDAINDANILQSDHSPEANHQSILATMGQSLRTMTLMIQMPVSSPMDLKKDWQPNTTQLEEPGLPVAVALILVFSQYK